MYYPPIRTPQFKISALIIRFEADFVAVWAEIEGYSLSDYAEKGNTILVTTHQLPITEKISDVVAIIERGKIKKEIVLREISGSLDEFYKKTIKGDWN